MTRYQDIAVRLRWCILVLGLFSWAIGLFWILDVWWPRIEFDWLEPELPTGLFGVLGWSPKSAWTGFGGYSVYIGLFLLTQWAFLAPQRGRRIELTSTDRPLWRSVIAAGLMAALLTTGLIAVLLELPDWWGMLVDAEHPPQPPGHPASAFPWFGLGVLGTTWMVWAIVFALYWRQGDRYTQLGRMLRGLIAGTLLELLIAIPAHVWVMRQRDCYCARGTYTGLVLGGTVLLWVFGPGLVLLFLRERYRREKLHPVCYKCGYDLRGNPSTTSCPECGAPLATATDATSRGAS